jgi:hypothetical protein
MQHKTTKSKLKRPASKPRQKKLEKPKVKPDNVQHREDFEVLLDDAIKGKAL